MRRFAPLAAAALLLAMVGACASHPAERLGPSPRPECASADGVIYFEPDAAELTPIATAIISTLMRQIDQCRSAGGELLGINIAAYPDRDARGRIARAEAQARASVVREALIEAGAPARTIRTERRTPDTPEGRVMQRRVQIVARLH